MKQKKIKNKCLLWWDTRRRGTRRRDARGRAALSDDETNPFEQLEGLASRGDGSNKIFIFRHYNLKTPEAREALAFELAHACCQKKIAFMVAADPALAFKLGRLCAGVHFPEWQVSRAATATGAAAHARGRARGREGWMMSAAAHSLPALYRAARMGADFALLSPVFAPFSKEGQRSPLGVARFAAMVRASPVPVFALGGISQHAPRLQNTQALGLAGVSLFAKINASL